MTNNTTEALALDFDGWLAGQDDETRRTAEEHFKAVAPERQQAEKQRLASMYFVAESTGLDLHDVDREWDVVRGGFAEQQGGAWLNAKDDDAAFHGELVKHATKRRDERFLLTGKDQEDWQNSLTFKAQEAAYRGAPFVEALSEWQMNAKGRPGYDEERFGVYEEIARTTHARMDEMVKRAKPVATRAFDLIAKARGVDGADGLGENDAPFALFRGLTPEEKTLAFRMMRERAEGMEGEGKGRWQALFEATGRGFENVAVGGNLAAFNSWLLRRKPFAEGDKVTEADPFAEVRANFRAEFADDLDNQMAGAQTLVREVGRVFTGRKLTAEEAARWNESLASVREDLETAEQLRTFGQQTIDPAQAGGWLFRKMAIPLADSVAVMTASGFGGWQGFLANARSYQGQEFARLRAEGMDAAEADKLAEVAGLAQAGLDKVQFGVLAKGLPGTARVLEQFALSGSRAARFGLAFGGTLLAETGVELVQDHVIPAIVQDNLSADPRFDVAWGEVWKDAAKAAPEVALGMVLLSGMGAGFQTMQETNAVRDLANSAAAMRLRGYSMEQIEEIRNAPDESKGALLAQYLPAKAPEGVERAALVAESVELAKQERAAFEAKTRQDAVSSAEAADYAVRVTRTGSGWWVTFGDKSVQADSAEAARRIRDDLRQARTEAEAVALVGIVDRWHESAPEGTARETALSGALATGSAEGIQYTQNGQVVREVTSPEVLETLHAEARMDAETAGAGEINVVVNGSNVIEFGERVANGARKIVQRLELNQSESTALTALHEQAEAAWRTGIASGAISLDETRAAVASVAGVFDPAQARDEADRGFRERVQRVASGEASETEVRETVSELAVADAIGRRKDGGSMPAGAVSTALEEAIRAAQTPAEVKTLGKLRAFLRAAKQYFRAVLGTVAALKKAKREGGTEDFDRLMDKILGRDEQVEHDRAAAEEAAALANEAGLEYTPPSEEEVAAGIAFSVSPAAARATDQEYMAAVEWGDMETAQRMVDEAAKRAGYVRKAFHGTENGGFTEFDPERAPKRSGFVYFSTDKGTAASYSGSRKDLSAGAEGRGIYTVYVKEPEQVFDFEEAAWDGMRPDGTPNEYYADGGIDGIARDARDGGINSFEVQNVMDEGSNGDTAWYASTIALSDPSFVKSADPVTYDEQGAVIPLSQRFNDGSNDIRFRLSPRSQLELIQRQLDTALDRDPERRRALRKLAADRLQKMQFDMESERVTPWGDRIRPVDDPRAPESLDKEAAIRQALRTEELTQEGLAKLSPSTLAAYAQGVMRLEDSPLVAAMLGDHGKLISKSTAARRGASLAEFDGAPWLPPQWYAGHGKMGLMPDEMAQALYDSGLLKEPTPDALWSALDREIQTARNANEAFKEAEKAVKEVERQARNTAREETAEWRREAAERQKKDYNPRTALVRDMRALDAILTVMPAEVRARVGGFIQLARLGTAEARQKEIARRITRLSGLLETHLRKENQEALDALIERAKPDGGKGDKLGGKIGVIGHRIFKLVESVKDLDEDAVTARRAVLEEAITKAAEKSEPGKVNKALLDLDEELQILDQFGAFKEKDAAAGDAAIKWLRSVYKDGRSAWRAIEETRAEVVAGLQSGVIEAMGDGADSLAQRQRQKSAARTVKKWLSTGALEILSFVQVLENLLGPSNPLVQRWNRAARAASAAKTDSILAANGAFMSAAKVWFKGAPTLEIEKRLWAMSHEQTITIPKREGVTSQMIEVPREKVEQFRDGTADPAAFGLDEFEADTLIAQLDAEEFAGKKILTVERINPGEVVEARLTEMEAVTLTMLTLQGQYAQNLARHGYDSAVIAAANDGLSEEAKFIRAWLLKYYADSYGPLSALYQQMFGIDLPKVANYSPAAFIHEGQEREMDPFGGGMLPEGGFRSGFLRERKKHTAEPKLQGALAVWQGHVAMTEHWLAFAPLVRELKGVFGNTAVKKAVEGARGSEMVSAVSRWIQAFEANGLQGRSFVTIMDRIARELMRKQASLTLAWKAGTLAKQSLATIASAAKLPPGVWSRGFVRVLRGQVDVKALRESPMIQRRIESGFSPEIRAAMASYFDGKPTRWAQFVRRGLETMAEVDAFFTSIGTAIAFDYHRESRIAAGMDPKQATQEALVEAEDVLGRTGQPMEMMDRSLYELAMSPTERIMFMFASNQRMLTAHIIAAYQKAKAGQITKQEAAHVLAVTWLASGFGSALIGAAWRDSQDDDDQEFLDWEHWSPIDLAKSTLLGPLGGLPFANLLSSELSGFGTNPFKPVGRAIAAWNDILEGDKAEPVEKTLRRVVDIAHGAAFLTKRAEGVAIAGNIVEQAWQAIDNLWDTNSEETAKIRRAAAKARREAREQ